MSRILFEPKRRLWLRIILSFALVLALQGFLSVYLVLNAMDHTLQDRLDLELIRVGSMAATDPLLPRALNVQADDQRAPIILGMMSEALNQLISLTGVRRAHLFRVEGKRFTYLAGTLEEGQPVPRPQLTNNELSHLKTGQTVVSQPFRSHDGVLVKAAYIPIIGEDLLSGVVVIEDDVTDLEVLTALRKRLYFVTLVGFIIVAIVSFLLARPIVRPVRNLVDLAEKLGTGHFNARFNVRGHDEINFLGQTLNDMAEDIQARDEQIRRMNEAALADARQLYEHVLRQMVSGMLTIDLNGQITSENPAATRLLGEARGGNQNILSRLGDHPALLALWQEGQAVENREIKLQTDEGERFFEVTLQPLYDHRNQQIGQSLSLVDRTETKHLEQELAMRERLAALGELAAGIAHEIRNPLNGIELMLGLVQEDLIEKGLVDERFMRIHNEVARLNVILTDFLMFARPKPLEPEPSNLIELLEDALMLTAADLENKQINVVRHYDDHIPDTMLDNASFRRVLVNLIKNACQAMSDNGHLEVGIRAPDKTDNGFLVTVHDNGPGIPENVIERLFHPFVTTKADGTGLGLSIVHKTIVNHQGSIRCYNHQQGGACFEITLPYVEVS